jgi:hypothetical protein
LTDARFETGLALLSIEKWVRPVETWKPKGKSPNSQFRSLAKHLLVKYTMPEFFYSVFFEGANVRQKGFGLFVHLGQGGSLYKFVKAGKFPVPLTKRMCHVFMGSTVKLSFLEAVRHAQVHVHGGDRRVAKAIYATRQLSQINTTSHSAPEDFWDTVIQWTCNQPMLAPSQIGPIYDWIQRQRGENVKFSMKGRTGLSVLRAVENWHGELARERKIHGHIYEPSGFEAWSHDRKVKLPTGGHHWEAHTITEVGTSKELAAEGRALKHCVYSYSWSVQRGVVSIWSYKIDGERQLTIEVNNQTKQIVQCRGAHNRAPVASEVAQVRQWMRENGLVASKHLPGF